MKGKRKQKGQPNIVKIQEALGIDLGMETIAGLYAESSEQLMDNYETWLKLGDAVDDLIELDTKGFVRYLKTDPLVHGRLWSSLSTREKQEERDSFAYVGAFVWGYTLGRAKERYQKEVEKLEKLLKSGPKS